VGQALTVSLAGHHRALLCAADIAASAPSLGLAARLAPGVPIRDQAPYRADPWRALVDFSAAEDILGWRPRYRWFDRGQAGRVSGPVLTSRTASGPAALPGIVS
jgi:hypothetical protein